MSFPVVAYRAWRWWLATAVAFFAVAQSIGVWVAGSPEVQATIGTPSEIDELVNHDFASYYSEHPAASFALQVWAEQRLGGGAVHRLRGPAGHADPVRAVRTTPRTSASSAGLMFDAGKGDVFLGLLTPHGLLELTAVFLARPPGCGWAGR